MWHTLSNQMLERHCQWLQVCIMWHTLSNQTLEDITNGYRYVSCDTQCQIKHWKTLPMVTVMCHVIHNVQSNAWRHYQWLQVCIMWLTLSNQMLEDIANGYRYVSCDSHCPIKCWKTSPMVTGMYHVTHTVQSNTGRHRQWLQVCIMWLTLSNQMLEDIANGYRYVSCDTQCPMNGYRYVCSCTVEPVCDFSFWSVYYLVLQNVPAIFPAPRVDHG